MFTFIYTISSQLLRTPVAKAIPICRWRKGVWREITHNNTAGKQHDQDCSPCSPSVMESELATTSLSGLPDRWTQLWSKIPIVAMVKVCEDSDASQLWLSWLWSVLSLTIGDDGCSSEDDNMFARSQLSLRLLPSASSLSTSSSIQGRATRSSHLTFTPFHSCMLFYFIFIQCPSPKIPWLIGIL